MLWELSQQVGISRAMSRANEAQDNARSTAREIKYLQTRAQELEREVARQHLILMAVTELMRDRLGISDEELALTIAEIDMRDGQLDGKLQRPPEGCPQCQRPNAVRRSHCLYCGTELSRPVI